MPRGGGQRVQQRVAGPERKCSPACPANKDHDPRPFRMLDRIRREEIRSP